uniref:PHD-type domain-containing protein n=1 Tax=Steinernema glaseri TaxID=37863 RepID=A0A1I7YJB6_9BILA
MDDDSGDESDEGSASVRSTDSELESVETDEELELLVEHNDNAERIQKLVDRWNAPFANAQFIEPEFHEVPRFAVRRKKSFHLNPETAYFTRKESGVIPDYAADTVEYEIDHEDLIFLKKVNEAREEDEDGAEPLSERKFEKVMDALEKACHFQCTDQSKQFDQTSGCCICRKGEADQSNQILFCDMCNIAVHQDCYGVPYIPEGQWFCRRCQISPSVAVNCVACFQSTGALKRTTCGRWAHVVCTIWVDELHFGNTAFMEPIENVDLALKRRRKLRCIVCKKRGGACIQCSKKKCSFAFHVTCAIAARFEMRVNKSGDGEASVEAQVYTHFIFCRIHSYGKSSHGSKKRKSRSTINVDDEVLNEKAVTSIPVITEEKVEEIASFLNVNNIEQIVGYWFQKRQAHGGIPMIRRLQVAMTGCRFEESSDEKTPKEESPEASPEAEPQPGPSGVTFGSSEFSSPAILHSEDNAHSSEDIKAAQDLKTMLSMVLRREKLKRTGINLRRSLFEEATGFTQKIMLETLDLLAAKDVSAIFAEPVKEEEVPGYHRIIKQPMDLSEMRRKVEEEVYKSLADLKADFTLMMDNCKAFNKENAFFLDYGNKFRTAGLKIFRQQDKRHEECSKVVSDVLKALQQQEKMEVNEEEAVVTEPEETKEETPPVLSQNLPFTRYDNVSFPRAPESAMLDTVNHKYGQNNGQLLFRSNSADSHESANSHESASENEDQEEIDDLMDNLQPIDMDDYQMESLDAFIHDDIVWVDGFAAPGRIFDERNKLLLPDDISFSAIMQDKPKVASSIEYCLVFFFDSHKSWGWFPASDLKHCDIVKEAENSRSDMAIEYAKRYWDRSAQLE